MSRTKLLLLGALGGLTWAAALRGWMSQIAGAETSFDWVGTFVGVILPGIVVGLLLGWAEHLRRTGGRRGWRWLALAPALFPIPALAMPGALALLVSTGIGGGAIAVTIVGIAGGFALGQLGPPWARILVGVVLSAFAALGLVGLFTTPDIGPTAYGLWLWLNFVTLMFALALATSIPFRKVSIPPVE